MQEDNGKKDSKKVREKGFLKDYADFLSAPEVSPPHRLSRQIIENVHSDLNPSPMMVFSKMTAIHLVLGAVVLFACPHFGLHIFDSINLMNLFMKYGEMACMMGCGAVFIGLSSLIIGLSLRPSETQVIKNNRILQLTITTAISVGAFICSGTSTLLTLGLAWTLGGLLGGIVTFEIGYLVKTLIMEKFSYGK